MQVEISIHDEKGEILRTISCPQSMISIQEIPEGGGYIEGARDGRFYYAVGGEPVLRPPMNPAFDKAQIAADGVEVITLSNLPDPCQITYTGPTFRQLGESTGGEAQFNTDATGTHTVRISAFPYLNWEVSFDAI
jgi:hypothetical protein